MHRFSWSRLRWWPVPNVLIVLIFLSLLSLHDSADSGETVLLEDTGRTRTAVSRFAGARLFCSATVSEPPRGVEPLRAGSKPAALPAELRRQAGAASAPGSSDRPLRRQKWPRLRQHFLKRRPDPH